jgi:hypothetical protein
MTASSTTYRPFTLYNQLGCNILLRDNRRGANIGPYGPFTPQSGGYGADLLNPQNYPGGIPVFLDCPNNGTARLGTLNPTLGETIYLTIDDIEPSPFSNRSVSQSSADLQIAGVPFDCKLYVITGQGQRAFVCDLNGGTSNNVPATDHTGTRALCDGDILLGEDAATGRVLFIGAISYLGGNSPLDFNCSSLGDGAQGEYRVVPAQETGSPPLSNQLGLLTNLPLLPPLTSYCQMLCLSGLRWRRLWVVGV